MAELLRAYCPNCGDECEPAFGALSSKWPAVIFYYSCAFCNEESERISLTVTFSLPERVVLYLYENRLPVVAVK